MTPHEKTTHETRELRSDTGSMPQHPVPRRMHSSVDTSHDGGMTTRAERTWRPWRHEGDEGMPLISHEGRNRHALCVGNLRRIVVAVCGLAGLVALACVYVPTWSGSHDAGTGHLANAFDIHEGPLVTDHPGEAQPGLGRWRFKRPSPSSCLAENEKLKAGIKKLKAGNMKLKAENNELKKLCSLDSEEEAVEEETADAEEEAVDSEGEDAVEEAVDPEGEDAEEQAFVRTNRTGVFDNNRTGWNGREIGESNLCSVSDCQGLGPESREGGDRCAWSNTTRFPRCVSVDECKRTCASHRGCVGFVYDSTRYVPAGGYNRNNPFTPSHHVPVYKCHFLTCRSQWCWSSRSVYATQTPRQCAANHDWRCYIRKDLFLKSQYAHLSQRHEDCQYERGRLVCY